MQCGNILASVQCEIVFDTYAQELFNFLPDLPGLTPDGARRMLSRAYLSVIRARTGGASDAVDHFEIVNYLRRLADTMEFYAVLDEDAEPTVRRAGAFVTAESLALLAELYDQSSTQISQTCRFHHDGVFTRIESGLLYLIAGYDANASGVVGEIPPPVDTERTPGEQGGEWALDILIRFCRFLLNPPPPRECPIRFERSTNLDAGSLEDDTIGRLYGMLSEAVAEFMNWLAGENPQGLETADQKIRGLMEWLGPRQAPIDSTIESAGGDFTRIRHLASLLAICLPELRRRALIELVPTGPGINAEQYDDYLKQRAKGDVGGRAGRPVLWPSAKNYVEKCIRGDAKHAVVSMPTGSGKSFIAELAVSHAVGDGWVLYLAPTNALTQQIRQDLRTSLEILKTQVMAFVGDQEYSSLKAEVVSEMPNNAVAVMTPEKASLALRLYPETFESCRLVVFDECHLIGDSSSGRGVTAELVMSRLMLLSPGVQMLLMSAIIQNPQDLARWLTESTGEESSVVAIPWRPTRALRSAVGIDAVAARSNYRIAKNQLSELPPRRINMKFLAPHMLFCGLQGAWQSTDEADYGISRMQTEVGLNVSRKKRLGTWAYALANEGWVNESARNVATHLAERGIQTLTFIPANRHYPFSNAAKTEMSPDYLASLEDPPAIVETCRVLAEYEFGCLSSVFELIADGISVHTSHMIETEKIASEAAFRNQATRLMYATSTLAQGLNLPATAVVIAGTRIGDPRGEDASTINERLRSQLLNAAGRAGRAGFANQGLVVAVPNKPLVVESASVVNEMRRELSYLQHPDNAVEIISSLESFLDNAAVGVLTTESASDVELQTIAALSGGDVGQLTPAELLSKSYASYLRKKNGQSDASQMAGNHLIGLRDNFVQQENAPEWVPIAAQRAGLDYFLTLYLLKAWRRVRRTIPSNVHDWGVFEWTDELLQVIGNVPPSILMKQIPKHVVCSLSPDLKSLVDADRNGFIEPDQWKPDDTWTQAWSNLTRLLRPWMEGRPLVEIASSFTSADHDQIDYSRNVGNKPIPKAIALTGNSFSQLALIAGGLVAVAEQLFVEFSNQGHKSFDVGVPLSLNTLPMCIKYGCDSPGSLAWYRFGIRLRRPSRLLYEAFTPPDLDDVALRDWVRNQRSEWLNGEFNRAEDIFNENELQFRAIADFLRQD